MNCQTYVGQQLAWEQQITKELRNKSNYVNRGFTLEVPEYSDYQQDPSGSRMSRMSALDIIKKKRSERRESRQRSSRQPSLKESVSSENVK